MPEELRIGFERLPMTKLRRGWTPSPNAPSADVATGRFVFAIQAGVTVLRFRPDFGGLLVAEEIV